MNAFMQDVRYGLRMLLKNPGSTAVVVLSLALGIGANTTIFSVVNSLLFRPPAVDEPARLVDIWMHNVKRTGFDGYFPLNFPDFVYYRDHNSVFSGLTAYAGDGLTVVWSRDGQGEALQGTMVSANYFSVLGIRPELGRTFLPEEDRPGAAPAVVVSHAFWRRHLGADPTALSRPIMLNGHACAVVGVIPDSFNGVLIGATMDVWAPMSLQPWILPDRPQLVLVGSVRPPEARRVAPAGAGRSTVALQTARRRLPRCGQGYGGGRLSCHAHSRSVPRIPRHHYGCAHGRCGACAADRLRQRR